MKIIERVVFITKILSEPFQSMNGIAVHVEVNRNYELEEGVIVCDSWELANSLSVDEEIPTKLNSFIKH